MEQLQQLPTVGPKTASRLAFYLLDASKERVLALAKAMVEVKERLRACTRCGNIAEDDLCEICRDRRRDETTICVVANTRDLMAMENSGEYAGLYHVLGGLISPLDGIGPEQLNIASLQERLAKEPVREIILATNPTVSGEATALYLKNILGNNQVKITRLASGLPLGAALEYADPLTRSRAIGNRQLLKKSPLRYIDSEGGDFFLL